MNLPQIVKIKKIIDEADNLKTFFFNVEMHFRPGQFVMVWIPGLDEKPFTFSHYSNNEAAITVDKKGKFTQKLFEMKVGGKIGIRGPFGNGFIIQKNPIVVGGGCGCAPLAPLIEKLENPIVIIGAKTKNKLLFKKRFSKYDLKIATDDGSEGAKGFVTQILEEILKKSKKYTVYTCGPEIMMKTVFEICEKYNVECEASLERFMKCGVGICGACACGEYLVCKDGPVFNSERLRKLKDFGRFIMLKSGKRVSLQEFYAWRS